MTPEDFYNFASDELIRYATSNDFKARAANILERQAAGEDFTVQQIADALGIPLWLGELCVLQAMKSVEGHVQIPERHSVH